MTDETRESIGTIWHTTEKGRDIVSMHDYQYRAHTARIAELEKAVEVLAKTLVIDRAWQTEAALMVINDHDQSAERLSDCARACDTQNRVLDSNPIARAAVDAAKGGTK